MMFIQPFLVHVFEFFFRSGIDLIQRGECCNIILVTFIKSPVSGNHDPVNISAALCLLTIHGIKGLFKKQIAQLLTNLCILISKFQHKIPVVVFTIGITNKMLKLDAKAFPVLIHQRLHRTKFNNPLSAIETWIAGS